MTDKRSKLLHKQWRVLVTTRTEEIVTRKADVTHEEVVEWAKIAAGIDHPNADTHEIVVFLEEIEHGEG
jgi:hypothetical protein